MTRSIYLSDERYLAALERIRALIASGTVPFSAYDDTTPGNKSTACSWGLCSDDKEAWPDADDHLWPDQFTKHDRVAPLYRRPHHRCPFDTRQNIGPSGNGCFYTCIHFHNRVTPTRAMALGLYDEQIAKAKT
jgi:hypothetical protein